MRLFLVKLCYILLLFSQILMYYKILQLNFPKVALWDVPIRKNLELSIILLLNALIL
jgi:hypothetical protein